MAQKCGEKKAEQEEDRANLKDSLFTVRNDKEPLKSSYRNICKYLITHLLFKFSQLGLSDRAVFTYSEPPQQL